MNTGQPQKPKKAFGKASFDVTQGNLGSGVRLTKPLRFATDSMSVRSRRKMVRKGEGSELRQQLTGAGIAGDAQRGGENIFDAAEDVVAHRRHEDGVLADLQDVVHRNQATLRTDSGDVVAARNTTGTDDVHHADQVLITALGEGDRGRGVGAPAGHEGLVVEVAPVGAQCHVLHESGEEQRGLEIVEHVAVHLVRPSGRPIDPRDAAARELAVPGPQVADLVQILHAPAVRIVQRTVDEVQRRRTTRLGEEHVSIGRDHGRGRVQLPIGTDESAAGGGAEPAEQELGRAVERIVDRLVITRASRRALFATDRKSIGGADTVHDPSLGSAIRVGDLRAVEQLLLDARRAADRPAAPLRRPHLEGTSHQTAHQRSHVTIFSFEQRHSLSHFGAVRVNVRSHTILCISITRSFCGTTRNHRGGGL